MSDLPGMSSHSWLEFFKDAGIPADLSARYAVMFTDHRIQKDMLSDLDRDILSDIGIKAVGDKMAILKHAKFVAEQAKRDVSSKLLADGIKSLESRSGKDSSSAEQMIKSRPPPGRNSSKVLAKVSPKSDKEVKRQGSSPEEIKATVFERLGRNSPVNPPVKTAGVFNRLGGTETANIQSRSAGVLKKAPSPITVTTKKLLPTKNVLDRLGAEVPGKPNSSSQVSATVTTKAPAVKKVIRIKKKPVTAPSAPNKIVFPPSKPDYLSTDVAGTKRTTVKRKSNVLERLGDISVTSTTKHAVAVKNMAKTSPKVERKLIVLVPKKETNVALKRKSADDLNKQTVVVAKKPISSNTVSSSSARLFKGRPRSASSVFDRLGAR